MLDPGETSLQEVLRAAGYATGSWVEWHFCDAPLQSLRQPAGPRAAPGIAVREAQGRVRPAVT